MEGQASHRGSSPFPGPQPHGDLMALWRPQCPMETPQLGGSKVPSHPFFDSVIPWDSSSQLCRARAVLGQRSPLTICSSIPLLIPPQRAHPCSLQLRLGGRRFPAHKEHFPAHSPGALAPSRQSRVPPPPSLPGEFLQLLSPHSEKGLCSASNARNSCCFFHTSSAQRPSLGSHSLGSPRTARDQPGISQGSARNQPQPAGLGRDPEGLEHVQGREQSWEGLENS